MSRLFIGDNYAIELKDDDSIEVTDKDAANVISIPGPDWLAIICKVIEIKPELKEILRPLVAEDPPNA